MNLLHLQKAIGKNEVPQAGADINEFAKLIYDDQVIQIYVLHLQFL